MSASGTDKRPRPKRRKRQTSLTLDQDVWDRLKEVEAETTAKPSSFANKLLREALKLRPQQEA
jgi:hypothetical protein